MSASNAVVCTWFISNAPYGLDTAFLSKCPGGYRWQVRRSYMSGSLVPGPALTARGRGERKYRHGPDPAVSGQRLVRQGRVASAGDPAGPAEPVEYLTRG